MRVRDLKRRLAAIDDDAYVVVGGRIVADVEQVTGRAGGGEYAGDVFRRAAKGRDKALVFLTAAELGDGSQDLAVR